MAIAIFLAPLFGFFGLLLMGAILVAATMLATTAELSQYVLIVTVMLCPLFFGGLIAANVASFCKIKSEVFIVFSCVASLAWALNSDEMLGLMSAVAAGQITPGLGLATDLTKWLGMLFAAVAATCGAAFILVAMVETIFLWAAGQKVNYTDITRALRSLGILWILSHTISFAGVRLLALFQQNPLAR